MKKIRLFFLAFSTLTFCVFSAPNAGFAVQTAVSPNSSSEDENAAAQDSGSQDENTAAQDSGSQDENTAAQDGNPQGLSTSETEQETPGIPEDLPKSGTGIYENAFELWLAWRADRQPDESPYPDYICGVWSTDGSTRNLTFAVTKDEAGEAGKQEILDLVTDDSTVSFTYLSYPHHELWAIQLTLRERLGDETGAYGIGVDEEENRVHIDINSSNENSEAFMQECFQKYQDRVCFEIGDGITNETTLEEYTSYTDMGMGKSKGENPAILPWIWASCIGILILFAAIFLRARSLAVLQTTKGSTTAPSPVTRKQAIEAIKKNTAEPNPRTFQSILEELEEK